jgi:DNA-binding NarL/FixJ family response regulator
MITVLLVDDQPKVRQGLRMRLALEPDMEIVGEAKDGAEAVALAPRLHPDVVVMDIEMPGMNGIRATGELQTLSPQSAVVVLSIHDDPANRERARAAGAVAFVGKHAGEEALLTAIRQAVRRSGSAPGSCF